MLQHSTKLSILSIKLGQKKIDTLQVSLLWPGNFSAVDNTLHNSSVSIVQSSFDPDSCLKWSIPKNLCQWRIYQICTFTCLQPSLVAVKQNAWLAQPPVPGGIGSAADRSADINCKKKNIIWNISKMFLIMGSSEITLFAQCQLFIILFLPNTNIWLLFQLSSSYSCVFSCSSFVKQKRFRW